MSTTGCNFDMGQSAGPRGSSLLRSYEIKRHDDYYEVRILLPVKSDILSIQAYKVNHKVMVYGFQTIDPEYIDQGLDKQPHTLFPPNIKAIEKSFYHSKELGRDFKEENFRYFYEDGNFYLRVYRNKAESIPPQQPLFTDDELAQIYKQLDKLERERKNPRKNTQRYYGPPQSDEPKPSKSQDDETPLKDPLLGW